MGAVSLPSGGSSAALMPELNAVVMPLPTGQGTSGILGLDFLNAFDAVEIDWQQRPGEFRFVTHGGSWTSLTAGLSEVGLQQVYSGLLAATVHIDGKTTMPALLDTGAAFSTVNEAAAAALGLKDDPKVQPTYVTGADGSPIAMRTAERDVALSLGSPEVTIGNVRLLFGDLPAFAMLGLSTGPVMLLGLDVLLKRPRIVLSTTSRRMFL
eukprot:gnl/TRDRNA2_/TRDRNA2_156708_c0_seq2.p1 gnl/TRDRNA2_/TRDRNA2_156708_c0~~gnl/TRDRNA2_/TRDRNA2_156708_c0_seq2.p1  ORF type:complete len:217 (+),score=39.11 gnl/TRDRNA2_/TRDRNA2_156708_c0_seq2:22-651(+)